MVVHEKSRPPLVLRIRESPLTPVHAARYVLRT
jgi:hypothetical protein